MPTTITIGLSIPTELLAKIDGKRGDIPRSKFVQRLVEQAFKQRDTVQSQPSTGE
jgi:hypothetical protein